MRMDVKGSGEAQLVVMVNRRLSINRKAVKFMAMVDVGLVSTRWDRLRRK